MQVCSFPNSSVRTCISYYPAPRCLLSPHHSPLCVCVRVRKSGNESISGVLNLTRLCIQPFPIDEKRYMDCIQ